MAADRRVSVREITASDYERVLEVSEGVYGVHDYLPSVFHEWLERPDATFFGVTVDGELVGLEVLRVLDEGRTVVTQALRIHRDFQGMGLTKVLSKAVQDHIAEHLPSVERTRVAAAVSTQSLAMHRKQGFEDILEELGLNFLVDSPLEKGRYARILDFLERRLESKSADERVRFRVVERSDLDSFLARIHEEPQNESLLSRRSIVYDWLPMELSKANVTQLLSAQHPVTFRVCEGTQSGKILSMSHAGLVPRRSKEFYASVYVCDRTDSDAHGDSETLWNDMFTQHFLLALRDAARERAVYFAAFFPPQFSECALELCHELLGESAAGVDPSDYFEAKSHVFKNPDFNVGGRFVLEKLFSKHAQV